jgi:hypothetical protein
MDLPGHLPAPIVVADLSGDGWDDLVVRAGDGSLSVFFNNQMGSFWTTFNRSDPGDHPRRPGRLRRSTMIRKRNARSRDHQPGRRGEHPA